MLCAVEERGSAMDLEQAVRKHRPALVTFAFRMLRDLHDAEDAVQSGLARAAHALREGVRPDNERAWLYKIVLRETQNLIERKRVRTEGRHRIANSSPAGGESGTPNDTAKLYEAVFLEITQLPEVYRQIVLLRFCQHLSIEETAQVLELPTGTVKSYQARALQALQERMGPRLDGWV